MPHPSIAPDSYFWQRTLQLLAEQEGMNDAGGDGGVL